MTKEFTEVARSHFSGPHCETKPKISIVQAMIELCLHMGVEVPSP